MNEKEEIKYKENDDKKCQQLDDDFSENDNRNGLKLIKSPEEIAFLRKLNWTLLPLVFLIIFIQVHTRKLDCVLHEFNLVSIFIFIIVLR